MAQYSNPPKPQPNLINLDGCCTRAPAYAVPGLLPICSMSAITAPSGTGKTTLACLLAACVHPPAHQETDDPTVLWLSPLSDVCSQLQPRLQQLGVTGKRIRVFDQVYLPDITQEYHRRPFTIEDFDHLRHQLSSVRSYRLLIIDNAELFFTTGKRLNRQKLLTQLYRLHDLTYIHEIGIVFLLNTPRHKPNPFSGLLHSCIAEVCRTTYVLAQDPAAPDQRLLLCTKNALPFPTPTRRIATLAPIQFPTRRPALPSPAGAPSAVNTQDELSEDVIQTCNLSLFTPDPDNRTYPQYLAQLYAPKKRGPAPLERDFACEFLQERLKDGAASYQLIQTEIKDLGITNATLQRAKRHLQIVSHKEGESWYWHLPAEPRGTGASPVVAPAASAEGPTTSPRAKHEETCAPSQPLPLPMSISQSQPIAHRAEPEETCASSPSVTQYALITTPPACASSCPLPQPDPVPLSPTPAAA